jgi:hypothetical protein
MLLVARLLGPVLLGVFDKQRDQLIAGGAGDGCCCLRLVGATILRPGESRSTGIQAVGSSVSRVLMVAEGVRSNRSKKASPTNDEALVSTLFHPVLLVAACFRPQKKIFIYHASHFIT